MKKILILLTAVVLYSCDAPGVNRDENEDKLDNYNETDELYVDGWKELTIVKVRNCEYVLWHNGYGSDMEHYGGCANTEHNNEEYINQLEDEIQIMGSVLAEKEY